MTIETAFFGALGRDAELKTSANGKPYLRLNVRTGDGDAAQWVSVTAFDTEAIGMASRFLCGGRVYVEGKLTAGVWTSRDGGVRPSLSVMASHCRLSQIGRNRPRPQQQRDDQPNASDGRSFDDSLPI